MERMKPGPSAMGQGRSAVLNGSLASASSSGNDRSGTRTLLLPTWNGSYVAMNSPHSGSAVSFAGTVAAAAAAAAPWASSDPFLQTSLLSPARSTTPVLNSGTPQTTAHAVPPQPTLTPCGQSGTGRNVILGQTRQWGSPNASGTASTAPQILPGTPTGPTGGIAATLTRTPLAPRLPPPAQNPTNIPVSQLSPGLILVPGGNGQLVTLPQYSLAQMQAQVGSHCQPGNLMELLRPETCTKTPPLHPSALRAPATPILARREAPTSGTQPVCQAQATLQPNTAFLPSPAVQPQIALGGSAQTTGVGTAASLHSAAPLKAEQGAPRASAAAAIATMGNVQKCQHYLSTLIQLASSGKRSPEIAATVQDLVQNLLDGKMEAEDFTSSLYGQLKISPRPCLVPFLKSTLPALRQVIPDSAAFIQQSQQSGPWAPTAGTPSAVGGSSSPQQPAAKPAVPGTSALQPPVIGLAQPAPGNLSKPGQARPLLIHGPQPPGGTTRPAPLTRTPSPTLPPPQPLNHSLLAAPRHIQLPQLPSAPMAPAAVLPPAKALSTVSERRAAAPNHQPQEPRAASVRGEEDWNDVTSLAGVDLSEESARMSAASSTSRHAPTRSCRDRSFLLAGPLRRRMLAIGQKYGITQLHPDAVRYVSQATEQRLRNLVEEVSQRAQRMNVSYEDDGPYEQVSDVRAQLRFWAELEEMKDGRKEEAETESFLPAATSGSRQEDPEEVSCEQQVEETQAPARAQKRQREADFTAGEGTDTGKKRKMDAPEPGPGSATEALRRATAVPGTSGLGTARQLGPRRMSQVSLRDLIFSLETERESRRSLLLYRAFLK